MFSCLICYLYKESKQPPEVFYKKNVLANFAKFTSVRFSFLINIFYLKKEAGTGVFL